MNLISAIVRMRGMEIVRHGSQRETDTSHAIIQWKEKGETKTEIEQYLILIHQVNTSRRRYHEETRHIITSRESKPRLVRWKNPTIRISRIWKTRTSRPTLTSRLIIRCDTRRLRCRSGVISNGLQLRRKRRVAKEILRLLPNNKADEI
uniref:Uncharacterized protein n=1 Tax=Cacopsylla melanoneura TaxID=428564 RepID=A0A8D8VDN7_9HEMI